MCVKKRFTFSKRKQIIASPTFNFSCNVSFSSSFFTVLKQFLITYIRAAIATHSFTMSQLASQKTNDFEN